MIKINFDYWKLPIGILLLFLLSIFIGIDFGAGNIRIFFLVVGTLVIFISAIFFPEIPIVILTMGMPIWTVLFGDIVDGIAIPITLVLAFCLAFFRRVLNIRQTDDNVRKRSLRLTNTDFMIVAFTIWLLVSLLWTPAKSYGVYKTLGFISYSVVGYILIRLAYGSHNINGYRLAWLMLFVGMAHAGFVVYASFSGGAWNPAQLDYTRTVTIKEFGLNFINEADSLVLGLIASMALVKITKKHFMKIILIGCFLLQFWALLTYQQRGASLSLIIGSVVLLAILNQKERYVLNKSTTKRLAFWIFMIVLMLGMIFVIFLLNPQFAPSLIQQDANVLTRLQYYRLGWEAFLSNPFFGLGIGGLAQTNAGLRFYVHNQVIEVLAELGLIGFLLFLSFSWTILKKTRGNQSPGLFNSQENFLLGVATAALVTRYTVGLSSGDLVSWNAGVWAGIIVALSMPISTKIRLKM